MLYQYKFKGDIFTLLYQHMFRGDNLTLLMKCHVQVVVEFGGDNLALL